MRKPNSPVACPALHDLVLIACGAGRGLSKGRGSMTLWGTVGSPSSDQGTEEQGHLKQFPSLCLSGREKELMKNMCFKVSRLRNTYHCAKDAVTQLMSDGGKSPV